MEFSYIILLGLAVSIDGFFAGIAYGIKGIKIPWMSLTTISAATLLYTGIAAHGSQFLIGSLNPVFTTITGSALLILIGLFTIYRQFCRTDTLTAADPPLQKKLTFSLGKIVISIIKKPEHADIDHSNRLNMIEALLLGTALGLDNMVATFAAGLTAELPIYTPFVLCIIQTLLVYAGIVLAPKIILATHKKCLVYIPGIVLICIGLFRLL